VAMSDDLSGWNVYQLGQLIERGSAELQTGPFGTMLNSSEYTVTGTPVIAVQDICENKLSHHKFVYVNESTVKRLSRYKVKKGDIIFGRKGAVERRAIIKKSEDGWLQGSDCIRLRFDDSIDATFISYQFGSESHREWMLQFANGATMPSLNQQILKLLPIRLPPLPEQKAIAAVLSSLDDKIDLLHRQNKTLESMAETLFRQWFIEEAQDVCEEYSVSDFADHVKENVVPAKSKSGYYHHYSLPAFDEGRRPTLELGSEILSNKYKVVEHSILVSKLNPKVPRIWPVSSLPSKNSICSTEFQVLKPKNIKLYGYLLFLLRSNDAVDALSMAASGTSGSHQRVRPEDIFNIKTSLPSLARAEQYSNMVMPGIAKTCSNLLQINILEILRDTLLPKLMSGEVRVIN